MLFLFGLSRGSLAYPYLVYIFVKQTKLEKCLFLFHLCTAVVGSCSQPSLKNEKSRTRTTLISTICWVKISFLNESEVKLFDMGHRHVVLKQEEKTQILKMR